MKLYGTPIGAGICVALFILCTGLLATQALAAEVSETGSATRVVTELSRQESDPLDRAANAAIGKSQMQARTIVRVKHVKLDVASILNAPTIRMNFFTDVSLVVAQDKVTKTVDGATHWVGHVGTNKIARALFVIKHGNVVGSIHYGIHVYQIRPVESPSGAVHAIYEIDQTKFPPENHHARPPLSSLPSLGEIAHVRPPPAVNPRPTEMTLGDTPALTQVDLLVAYGNDVNSVAAATIISEIDHAVDQANQTFKDTGINLFLCLVDRVNVPTYGGTGGITAKGTLQTVLECLIDATCSSTIKIRDMRDSMNVDLVSVWVETGDECGTAITNNDALDQNLGYSVVNRSGPTCATSNYSMVHEFGHTMGTEHERAAEHVGAVDVENGQKNYGYFLRTPTPGQRTIMATQYACPGCPRIGLWSNPSLSFPPPAPSGIPMGVVELKNAADNAGTLEANKNKVAKWRDRISVQCKNTTLNPDTDTTPPARPTGLNIGVR